MIGRHANRGAIRLRAAPDVLRTKPEQNRNISPAITIAIAAHIALVLGLAVWKLPVMLRVSPPSNEPLSATITFAGMREADNSGGTGGGNPNAGGRGDEMPSRLLIAPPVRPKLQMPPLPEPQPQLPRVAVESTDATRLVDYQPSFVSANVDGSHGFGHGTGNGVGDGNAEGVVGNGHDAGTGEGDSDGIGFGGANYLRSPQPHYPALARERGWEGTAVLRVEIQADGLIGAIEVVQSAGHSVLDDAAIEAVRVAQFQPARHNGTPIASWVEVPVTFRLNRG